MKLNALILLQKFYYFIYYTRAQEKSIFLVQSKYTERDACR